MDLETVKEVLESHRKTESPSNIQKLKSDKNLVNGIIKNLPENSADQGFPFQMKQEGNDCLQAETFWARKAYFSTKGTNLTARLQLCTSDQALNWRRKLPVACSCKGKPCRKSVAVEPSFSSRVPLKQHCRRL
ncbi:PREDICTED: uncharacterized protein LOC107352649 isoform X1 [Acropora digitifera]|uniref:uncharacterized protein LOC107352649 isoform X1 n=1 Tax=Acropora digitifera TaxID=70779 RepID=UPI00077AA423|nr:PREDICTED: uncharacterized protein LOC107352649 isoform X1 [Acropora digitifera]